MRRVWQQRTLGSVLVGSAVLTLLGAARGGAEEPSKAQEKETTVSTIQDNVTVQLEYTLTADGAVVDSTQGRGPFRYVQGRGQIIPGLERQLIGLHVGDEREIMVKPEEGYGPVDPSAFVEVPKDQLPTNVTPTVGLVLRGMDPEGRMFRATIHEMKDHTVMLDLNHPLAGKTLFFKIKVVDVAPAS